MRRAPDRAAGVADSFDFDAARRVADAVLYEGYLLYPYRSSAQKNRVRWQFGVLAPRAWSEAGGGEAWRSRTETLMEARDDAVLHVRLRCLHLETRDDGGAGSWDEGTEQEIDALVPVLQAFGPGVSILFRLVEEDDGRRRRRSVDGRIRVDAERLEGPYGVIRLRIGVENVTDWNEPGAGREQALRRSLVATHLLVGGSGASFLSLTDPPEWARPAAEGCAPDGLWPVLLGGDGQPTVVLASPIILPDGAEVAEESPGDLFDATEIDEILGLRILALTDDEKREARATDPRAAAIVDRLENMPPEVWDRLHGAVRSLRPVPVSDSGPTRPVEPRAPWWDPGSDTAVSPDTDSVLIGQVPVSKGHRVRLRPGRADAQDMFLAGRTATVEAVLSDVDGGHHLAVTVENDPAADLLQMHGRYLYFHPEEVEPL